MKCCVKLNYITSPSRNLSSVIVFQNQFKICLLILQNQLEEKKPEEKNLKSMIKSNSLTQTYTL